MTGSREGLPDSQALSCEIESLQHRIRVLARELEAAKRDLTVESANYQRLSRWEAEASKKYNSAESYLDHYSTLGDRQAAEQLQRDASQASQCIITQYHNQERARETLEKLQLEMQAVEKKLAQKMHMKSITEETTKKLFKSLGLKIETQTITLPYIRESKSLIAPSSAKKPREEILQLQKELTNELAGLQKKYHQKFAQIEEKLKSDDSQLRPRVG